MAASLENTAVLLVAAAAPAPRERQLEHTRTADDESLWANQPQLKMDYDWQNFVNDGAIIAHVFLGLGSI
jgi:hypothetical protein